MVQSQVRRCLWKAASELGLHYFLCRINKTVAVIELTSDSGVPAYVQGVSIDGNKVADRLTRDDSRQPQPNPSAANLEAKASL